ncbi:unnamed protein product [Triticum turgidum subsp. durum]|uniref:DUF4220 domain-containing protein n=1 Tax=Triticum turgidum subsp. durum TaxID=4567 RepID=A0A9R1B5H2_TRITD|nr:unnamed protein product [Triticum turgidum subsp. durum]
MGVSGAVQWWEEWQLRILVLGSLAIQYILLVASYLRKYPIRSWFRPVIWLAYLGSDAIAIYALAALFNRQKKQDGHGVLEVLWAPILLIHLGGQDGITAYNIEDNELWPRHILTAVSQVTVAVYVFCKSWPGSDDRNLLVAAVLLFIPGILKCFEKPLALNRASINSLVSSGEPITPYKLFVDLASPSLDDRIRMLRSFSGLDDYHVYHKLRYWLSETFQLLYTKEKMFMVSQYNLIGLLARNRRNSRMMWVMEVLGCSDFLQQRWRMKSCSSSFSITKLVLKYVKGGWGHHIRDVSSYRKFNDNRGQFTLGHEGCYQELGWSLEGAFDESVLLWHLATDFCYYHTGVSHSHHRRLCTQDSCPHAWCEGSGHHKRAIQCREMSNYMMYLLFVNPEMLMAGTRRNLFTTAYDELKGIIIQGDKQTHKEAELTQMIIAAVDGGGSPPPDGTQQQQGGIIRDAWNIAKVLSNLPEEKMWDVIEGVWVEMLCFSAARCRGYLHAKGLATGVEYLTYVWLLLYYMGMETLAAKLQRADHHYHNGGVHGDDPSTSRVSGAATNQEGAAGPSRSSGTYKEYAEDQSSGYQGSDATGEEIV